MTDYDGLVNRLTTRIAFDRVDDRLEHLDVEVRDALVELLRENAALAAHQCDGKDGDEYGNPVCTRAEKLLAAIDTVCGKNTMNCPGAAAVVAKAAEIRGEDQ